VFNFECSIKAKGFARLGSPLQGNVLFYMIGDCIELQRTMHVMSREKQSNRIFKIISPRLRVSIIEKKEKI